MSQSLKFGNVVLCEHAVRGADGNSTLVNVYSGNIILNEFPARVYIGALIEYASQKDDPYDLRVEFCLDKKILARIVAHIDSSEINGTGTITVPMIAIKVDKPAIFEVYAYADGFQRKKIAQKKIDIREDLPSHASS